MKKYLIVILITAVIISAMWISASKENEEISFDVTATTPSKKNIYDYVTADGRIKEGTRRDIYLKRPAEITRILISEGEEVKKGSPLFEIKLIDEEFLEESFQIDEKQIYKIFEDYGFEVPNEDTFTFVSGSEKIITSPIDGTVTSVNTDVGDNVSMLKKLASISDFSDLYIETMIPEAYSSKIHPGAEAKISAEAFGDTFYSGQVKKIAPVAKYVPSLTGEGKTYINAEVRTNSGTALFKPELTVKAKITVDTIKNALTLPYECIRQNEDGVEYVYIVENGQIRRREVKTGYELENEIQIISGIEESSVVVYNPDEALEENCLVNVFDISEKK